MSTDKERNALSRAYSGYAWQEKVAKMSNEQVVAIYLRFQSDGWPPAEPKLADIVPALAPLPHRAREEQIRLF